jgi:hypothetical protein
MTNQRERNRRREHAAEGHALRDTGRTSIHKPGQSLHRCTCSWAGWLKSTTGKE